MDFAQARLNMIKGQLETNEVNDEGILNAINAIPREKFVSAGKETLAYIDEDLEIKSNRYLMEPISMGRMLQAANITPNESVLVVGSATGYLAAVSGRLASSVMAVDSDEELTTKGEAIMADLALDNVVCLTGSPAEGYAPEAPYDVILVDGAVAEASYDWHRQLAEGGRMILVETSDGGIGRMVRYVKNHGTVSGKMMYDCYVKILPGFDKKKAFQL